MKSNKTFKDFVGATLFAAVLILSTMAVLPTTHAAS